MLNQTVKFCAMGLTRRKVCHEMFRRNSTKITDQNVPGFKTASVSKNDRKEFNSFYPVIVKDFVAFVKEMDVPEMTKWYPRLMEYNLLGGKQRRGYSVVLSYKLLEDPKKLTEENIRLANILGWSIELVPNDFLDCFGDVAINGATLYGDIREGKCSWPAVVTLQKATPEQRKAMDQCYGRPNEQSVQAVMDVYRAVMYQPYTPTTKKKHSIKFVN